MIHRSGHQDGLRLCHRSPGRQERVCRLWCPDAPAPELRITLGTPVDPLLHIPLALGDTTAGSGLSDWSAARAVSVPRCCSSTIDGRVDHLQHPGPLPLGQIPAHRNRNGADLPAAQRGQHEVLGIGNRKCNKRTDISAGGGQRPPPLIGPAVEFARRSSSVRVPSSAMTVRAGSSRRCSASSCKLGAERNSFVVLDW